MRDLNAYKFEDFVADPSFFNYAKGLDTRDIVRWENWLAKAPVNQKVAEEAREFIAHLIPNHRALPERFVKSEWEHLSRKLGLDPARAFAAPAPKRGLRFWHVAAACALVIFTLGTLFSKVVWKQDALAQEIEVLVPRGETRNILLPDNTLVYLNSDTRISYKSSFGDKNREVYLTGEAFFDVTYDERRPFLVNTPENQIHVLGTAFNVNAYPDEDLHRISLERGKIEVSRHRQDASTMYPDQTYLLLRSSGSSKIFKTESVEDYSSWSRGKITLRNQRFSKMVRDLERSYNVVFHVRNEQLLSSRYTGEFSREDDIRKILEIIQLTTDFEFEIEGDSVIIH
jgi:ferric-dicitrate binding protein FerR (iron transport regulator)